MNQTKHKNTGLKWLLPFLAAVVLSLASIVPVMAASAPNWNNDSCYGSGNPFTSSYKYQCSWYAWGRVREVMGIKMSSNMKKFVNSSVTGAYASTPSTNAVAVYSNSSGYILHVAYIENFDGTNVTYSEGNNKKYGSGPQKYYTATLTLSKFISRTKAWVGSSCTSLKYVPLQKSAADSPSVSIQTKAATDVGKTNATVNGQVTKTPGVNVTSCGVYLGTSTSNMTKRNTEALSSAVNNSYNGTGFKIWYNLTDELKIVLEEETTYYYKIYIICDGREYQGAVMSFKTGGHKHTPGPAATCTTNQVCTRCGEVLAKALGHTPGSGATCTTDQVCTRCGEVLAKALGHSPDPSASCTDNQICTRCGEVLSGAAGHTPGPEATCTTDQVCTKCGEVLAKALGHTPDSPAACTADQVCTRCGEVLEKASGHTPGPEATCTVDQVCTKCGEVLTKAPGHTPGPEATCTTDQVCTECGEVLTPAGHKWSAWTTVRGATVFTRELQMRSCSVCGQIVGRETGSKLKPRIKVSASTLTMRVKQTTTALKVTSMAKGDYLKSVSVKNKKLIKVTNIKKKGTFKLKALKKGTVKLTLKLASGKSKTVTVRIVKSR